MKKESSEYTIPVYRLQLVQDGEVVAAPVTGPEELAFQMKEVAMADREHMVVIFLDTKNRPIGRQVVSIGTLNATLVHPREIFKAALIAGAGAHSVICLHNHPSGVLTPSREDDEITQRIARAGAILNILLIDHVILAPDGGYFSYKNSRPELLDGGSGL